MILDTMPKPRERTHPLKPQPTKNSSKLAIKVKDKLRCSGLKNAGSSAFSNANWYALIELIVQPKVQTIIPEEAAMVIAMTQLIIRRFSGKDNKTPTKEKAKPPIKALINAICRNTSNANSGLRFIRLQFEL